MRRIYQAYGLLAAFAITLAACLFLIFHHEEGTHTEADRLLQENLSWELSRLQTTLFGAKAAIDSYATGGTGRDKEDVVLEFDLLRSRVQALQVGPGRDAIGALPGSAQAIEEITSNLGAMEKEVLALVPNDVARRVRIDELFQTVVPAVNRLVLDHARAKIRASATILQETKSQHQQVLLFFVGAVLLAASLAVVLMLERRNSQATLRTLQQRVDEQTSQLIQEEERLRRILDNMPSAFYLRDTEGYLHLANPLFKRWYGDLAEGTEAVSAIDIFPKAHAERDEEMVREVLDTRQVHEAELEVSFLGGADHTIHVTKFPILDSERRVLGIGTINTDITEARTISMQLEQSEAQLRQAVQLAGLGYWVWDPKEDFCVYCSVENARIHGVSAQAYGEMASPRGGKSAFVHADDRRRYGEALAALARGEAMDIEYRLVAPDGHERYVREVAAPERDADGEIVRECGTIQDLTEFHQAQERLNQAQKMEAIGQLTGGVAHDFNNLLAIILGNAELLTVSETKEDAYIQPILRAAKRGSELTQRLLVFSRRQPLSPKTVNLNKLINDGLALLDRAIGEAVEVKFHQEDDLWETFVDPGQVENALLNLAINARDAMSNSGTLTIATANVSLDAAQAAALRDAEAGDYVRLSVGDTGSGMSSSVIAKAFDPFFTTKPPGKGTGLGLSMVYGFARESGGHVAIDSKEGEGTTVHLYLPRQHGAVAVEEAAAVVPATDLLGAGETILVVEDNSDIRTMVEFILSDSGYRIVTAANAALALEKIEQHDRIQLLLSDIMLPGNLNGLQLADQVSDAKPLMKILLMTGYSSDLIELSGNRPMSWPLLRKPFSNQELAEAVRSALAS